MAHTLKLNIYVLEIKKRGERTPLTWQEFYKNIYGIEETRETTKTDSTQCLKMLY